MSSGPVDHQQQPSRLGGWRAWAGRINWQEELGLLLVYVLLVAYLSVRSPYFFTTRNFTNIFVAVSIIGILSIAATMVIVSGGIDLSIGSVLALAGVMVAQLSRQMPIPAAVAAALIAGAAVGVVNGLAVTRLGINPLIATLGTLSIVRGLAFMYSKGSARRFGMNLSAFWGAASSWESRFRSS